MESFGINMVQVLAAAERYQHAQPVIQAETAKGLTKMGFVVEAQAKVLVPVVTGTLRRSLTTQAATPVELVTVVGSNVPYAPRVEYGIGMKPRRFLRGAIEQKTAQMLAIAQGIPAEILKRLGAK